VREQNVHEVEDVFGLDAALRSARTRYGLPALVCETDRASTTDRASNTQSGG